MLLKDRIPLKYVFGNIRLEIVTISSYTILVWLLYTRYNLHNISIPLSVPAILGTVISLLLGFRSSQAYDRWWEARQVWGAIVNDSRSLTRQMLSFVEEDYQHQRVTQFRKRFVRRQIAWTYSLGQALRGKNALTGMERLLHPDEMEQLANYSNVPAAILNLHARDLVNAMNEGWINRYQQVEMDRTLTRLCDAQGKCERIKNTVFPVTYSTYIHFALLMFIAMLPFGLISFFGVLVIPLVAAIAACFLLIEKMAIQLQDPFDNKPTDTPMTTISKSIERDLRQMLDDAMLENGVMPGGKKDKTFYVM